MMRRTPLLGVATALTCAAGLSAAISVATADPGGPTMRSASTDSMIHLQAMPQAVARFFRGTGGDLLVKLSVVGVTPGSEHSIDVQRGTCPASFRRGADLTRPVTVQADATGQINETVDLGRSVHSHGPLALTLRQGVTSATMAGNATQLALQGLACTQIPHPGPFQGMSRQLFGGTQSSLLLPVSESGASLQGWASYTYNATDPQSQTGQSVTVTINATGFVPGSVHAAHIHSGTCAEQGGVVVMLPDLTADSKGHIAVTDTVPVTQRPQGPLYINIHEGNSNTILDSDGNPTLAFRPLLCGDVSQMSR